MISKNKYNFDSSDQQTFGFGILMVSSLHGNNLHLWEQRNCVHSQFFLEVFLSPFSDVIREPSMFLVQCRLRAHRSQSSKYWFSALSLSYRDFLRFSETFNNIMYSKCFLLSLLLFFCLFRN